MCTACDHLQVVWPIRTAGELSTALGVVQANVADGTLRDESDEGMRGLSDNEPWPDYIELRLRCCACGTRFKLTTETYHGTGGSWRIDGKAR